VLLSLLAEPLTGLVDTAFVATLGSNALAALGVGTVILTSGLGIFNFLSIGSQTEVAQTAGRNDHIQGRRIASLALLLALLIGVIISTMAYFCAPLLAKAMGATEQVATLATDYIQFRAIGGPAVLLTVTSFGVLYGLADMRSPLLLAIGINLFNIGLDYLLIFGIGPFPELGISGAALASSISQWLGAGVCLFLVNRKIGLTRQINPGDIAKLMAIGRDMMVRTGSLVFFLLLTTRLATQINADAGAAHQAVRQVWVFTNLFLDASAVTAQSIIGYYFGSGNLPVARRVSRMVCYMNLLIGIILLVSLLMATDAVVALFVPPTSLSFFYTAWIIMAVLQPITAVAFVTDGIHWGTGDFVFLRNVVLLATLCPALLLLLLDGIAEITLSQIWWATGLWIFIRALFGVLRIWPGFTNSPLKNRPQR